MKFILKVWYYCISLFSSTHLEFNGPLFGAKILNPGQNTVERRKREPKRETLMHYGA
jgi:hypothetical protein